MSTSEKSSFLHYRGKVSKARERWIFIECQVFGFAYKYLVGIRDCKTMAVAMERFRALGDIVEV